MVRRVRSIDYGMETIYEDTVYSGSNAEQFHTCICHIRDMKGLTHEMVESIRTMNDDQKMEIICTLNIVLGCLRSCVIHE